MTWRECVTKHKGDIASVVMLTGIDKDGITYEVQIALRSLEAGAVEVGDDSLCIWSMRVEFGNDACSRAGGHSFVVAAREQQDIADEVVENL